MTAHPSARQSVVVITVICLTLIRPTHPGGPMSSSEPTAPVPTAAQFRAAQQSEEFIELRRTHRSFAFPMTVAFFVWYLVFVIVGAFFPEFMACLLYTSPSPRDRG